MKKILIILLVFFFSITPVLAARSSNKYLKDLEIENHNIYFNKERMTYKIVVEEDENELIINAVPDDSKSKVVVKGADDLKANNYVVEITVTAENGNSETYTITASVKNEIVEKEEESFITTIQNKIKDLNIKTEYVVGAVAGIIFVILVSKLITHYKDKKIDNTMDKF